MLHPFDFTRRVGTSADAQNVYRAYNESLVCNLTLCKTCTVQTWFSRLLTYNEGDVMLIM